MRFPNTEHQPQSTDILRNDNGGAEYVVGMYALIFVLVMALASLQIMQYKADSDITEDALTASALAALDVDPYVYGKTHHIIISDPVASRMIFEDALRENMDLSDDYRPVNGNESYVKGRVVIDDYRVYIVSGDEVTEYVVSGDAVLENRGACGEMTTPSGKEVRSAGVYARISYDASGFLGVTVRAHKNTYVEMMADPDRQI